MVGLADFFNDPTKLGRASAFLSSFGQGLMAANQQGLSPFAALAFGFGQGGQGISQQRQLETQRRQRQLQEQLLGYQTRRAEADLAATEQANAVNAQIASVLSGTPPPPEQGGPVDLVPAGMRPAPRPVNLNDPAVRQRLAGLYTQLPGGTGNAAALDLLKLNAPDFDTKYEVINGKIIDKTTLQQVADLSDPRTQIAQTRAPNGDQVTQLINADTGEVIATLGQGPTSTDSNAKEEQIARIMETQGVDRATAVGLVDGVLQVVTDPQSGVSQIVNRATGTGEFVQNQVQMPGQSSPVAPENTLYSLADRGLIAGAIPAASELAGRVGGQVDLDIGAQTTEARQMVRNEAGNLIRALSINSRFPIGEMNRIREEVQIDPRLFDSESSLKARMRAVDTSLRRRLQNELRAMSDLSLPLKTRQDAASAANNIANFLAVLGVPQGGEETQQTGQQGGQQNNLSADDQALVDKYLSP